MESVVIKCQVKPEFYLTPAIALSRMATGERMNTILVTGAAGFIGYHVCEQLASLGTLVIAVDNLNDYYDRQLKLDRLERLRRHPNIRFQYLDVASDVILAGVFQKFKPDVVIHLAAQAGVRYSEVNPMAYTHSNIMGTDSVLACCRKYPPNRILYASSSSVYGNSTAPFSELMPTNPISYYAVTKVANELSAHLFHEQTQIPITGMRFFTVYGPWGRPDMAYWTFSKKILDDEPITLYGQGVERDFTYCGDVVSSMLSLVEAGVPGHTVVNIGGSQPVKVANLINLLQESYGVKAQVNHSSLPASDPHITWCDTSRLEALIGYKPTTPLQTGLGEFCEWYKTVHHRYSSLDFKFK